MDLRHLSKGHLIELLNLFHLEDSYFILPQITLRGASFSNISHQLLQAWLPYVRGNQIPNLLSGISPVRTLVNIGNGMADLILLPIKHYQQSGQVLRGVKEGAASFAKATAIEGIKLGTKLAVGAQIILEHAQDIVNPTEEQQRQNTNYSRYSNAPQDLSEGMQGAYESLSSNVDAAAKTILAVPVEVFEKEGAQVFSNNLQGTVKAVIRAVPVAMLKPAIGVSEAMKKTLLGLQSTIDATKKVEILEKYKQEKRNLKD